MSAGLLYKPGVSFNFAVSAGFFTLQFLTRNSDPDLSCVSPNF